MAHGYQAGRITGLYREDYPDNSTAAVFAKYRDVFREAQPALSASASSDDNYTIRIRDKRKDVN